jgi:hypothetical protein
MPVPLSAFIGHAWRRGSLQRAILYELHGANRDLPAADLLNPYGFVPADVGIVCQPLPGLR